ncbi:uncharacterized protein LOC130134963 [Syzygium oleosum]|uniref:uncharacterized protein LOC130134963 n=1 Tax=Syzygium oleosum TaxID=219896 RepID=UPI0024B937E9|nr:uncharacterized protein LOC130134963 [Syzygium oleosum]
MQKYSYGFVTRSSLFNEGESAREGAKEEERGQSNRTCALRFCFKISASGFSSPVSDRLRFWVGLGFGSPHLGSGARPTFGLRFGVVLFPIAITFFITRWKEAIAADHVKLFLLPESEPPGSPETQTDCQGSPEFGERSILGNAENRIVNGGTRGKQRKRDKKKREKQREKKSAEASSASSDS